MNTDDRDDDPDDRPRRRREPADYEEPHRGVLVLVLGIIGLVTCPVLGIAAWLMGANDLKAMDEGRMDPEGRQLTLAGKVLGIVATVLLAVQFLLLAFYLVVVGVVVAAKG